MDPTVPKPSADGHRVLAETRPRMARAHLRNQEVEGWRTRIGEAIERVRSRSGLSLKEFAAAVARDERQVARWINGAEHPQLAAIFAVEPLRLLLLIVLAELVGDSVEITTAITIRRSA